MYLDYVVWDWFLCLTLGLILSRTLLSNKLKAKLKKHKKVILMMVG